MAENGASEAGSVHGAAPVSRPGFLSAEGKRLRQLPEFARDPAALISLYRAMVRTRTLDAKAVALQRTGRLGTYASSLGQEAVSVGVASAMRVDDVLLPSFREHGAQLWRGVTPTEIFLYWGGDERGSDFAVPRGDFPVCIPVASHLPQAAGVALGIALKREAKVAVAIAGDGATSKGDFYEAINVMGVWRLPAVVVVCNNQWAISVPRSAQTAAVTLAHKAVAAGIPAEQVDGNDVVAVREAVERALARARAGDGATLIEAVTYRLADHTTSDDARRYRDDDEVRRHWKEEPLSRLRAYLVAEGSWGKVEEERLLAECRAEIDAAAEAYLAMPPQSPGAIFDHLFARLPEALVEQRAAVMREGRTDA